MIMKDEATKQQALAMVASGPVRVATKNSFGSVHDVAELERMCQEALSKEDILIVAPLTAAQFMEDYGWSLQQVRRERREQIRQQTREWIRNHPEEVKKLLRKNGNGDH